MSDENIHPTFDQAFEQALERHAEALRQLRDGDVEVSLQREEEK